MVVIEAHSKWPEIFVMEDTTAEETVSPLCSLFANWDSLSIWCLTTDHSSRQKRLGNTTVNGVKHVLDAPYHPSNQWSCGKIGEEFPERSNS